ncbi:MAG: ABC transporter permease, partial [Acetobacteraceae bacterium]
MTGRAERIAALVLAALLGLLGLSVPLELVGVSATRLAPWRDLLASAATREATLHTLIAGSASAVLATVLGGGFALLAGLTDLSRRRALSFLFLLLMVIPGQISVIAWIALTGPESPILAPLGLAPARGAPVLLFGPGGIIFLMGVEHAPIVFLALSGFLRALPADLIEAAASAGANSWRILTRILLPLARPAFAAGLSGAFAAGIANFATPALLGIPGRYLMLTTLIFQRLTGFGPSALGVVTALSALLALFCIAAVALERALVP